jgi:phosphoribosylanthranilate isomerase
MTKVKICGISQVDHALAAAEAGADFIGLAFAPSKRQVTPQTAREIVLALDSFKPRPLVVGVFVNTAVAEVNRLAAFCRLDWLQLSGDESWEYCQQVERPTIKTIHVSSSGGTYEILSELSLGRRILGPEAFTCLLDTEVKGAYGGTGQPFDWELAGKVSQQHPVIVAGGLSPENVKQAIRTAKPWGVDVSSGVETDGSKDISKIKAFVRAVRRADEEVKYTP